ncbi:MAG: hypothetical protein E7627_06410 [Ruminococcaceae bacterium]|nr:hypothetical protein [Oscillospiraceae bacterium]
MKKLLCTILALIMVFVTPVYITAEAEPEQPLFCKESPKYLATEVKLLEDYVSVDELKAAIKPQIENYSARIDVRSFGIPFTDEYLSALRNFLCEEMPEYFYINPGNFWSYDGSTIAFFDAYYVCTPDTYEECKTKWDAEVDRILDGIRGNDSLTEAQKALLIHDRLVAHCEYDQERLVNNTLPTESYMAYGALVNRICVCEGYSEAYCYLLKLVGIESYLCSSSQLNHEWNIVKIDGEYYHVDVTWDDPVWDIAGRVSHKNFLLSSSAFSACHKNETDFDYTPNSTKYDNYFWRNSDAAFQLIGDEIYYIDGVSTTINTYDGTELQNVFVYWPAGKGYIWPGHYGRTAVYGDNLLVSMPDAVYKYDTKAKTYEKFVEPEQTFGDDYSIFGMTFEDGTFVFEYSTTPNFTAQIKKDYRLTYKLDIKEPVTLTGKVTTYNPGEPALIELKVGDEVKYSVETETVDSVAMITQSFTINDVADGTYDLVVTKAGHLPYTITGITVVGESIDLTTHSRNDVADIVLIAGNTNGDKVVDLKDVVIITADDTYNKTVATAVNPSADINGDGLCELQDLIIITSGNNYNKGEVKVEY